MAVNIVTTSFTYDVADEYLLKTGNDGNTSTCDYTGPDAILMAINKETGKIDFSKGWEAWDGEDATMNMMNVRAGEGAQVVTILAADDPVICWLMVTQFDLDRDAGLQKEYKLVGDDTVYYSRPDCIYPDHAYEEEEIKYSFTTNSFVKPFPWKNPHMDWETILDAGIGVANSRQSLLDSSDHGLTDEEVSACEDYIAELKNLETKFKGQQWADGSDVQAWQVPFPDDPLAVAPPDPVDGAPGGEPEVAPE